MGARAQAVDATRRRIVDALIALAGERPFAEVTLDAVAERAGVSVQTVLRQFGSRDGLFAEADGRRHGRRRGRTPYAARRRGRRGPDRRRPLRAARADRAADAGPGGLRRRGPQGHRPWQGDAPRLGARGVRARRPTTRRCSTCWSWPPTSTRGSCCGSTAATPAPSPSGACTTWSTRSWPRSGHQQGALTWPTSSSSPGTAAATCRPPTAIAAELRRRGHGVRFVGHAAQRAPLEAAGLRGRADHARPSVRGRRPTVRARDDPDVRRPRPGPRRAGRAGRPSRRPGGRRLPAARRDGELRRDGRAGTPYVVLEHLYDAFFRRSFLRGPIGPRPAPDAASARAPRSTRPARPWSPPCRSSTRRGSRPGPT